MTETRSGGPPTQRVAALDDASDLDAFVADAPVVLVEFYTNGCGLCESMAPVLSNLARALDGLAVTTVNPRDDPPLIERFDVRSVPLLVLFVDGEPVARLAEGFVGGDELTAWVREHAPAGAL